MKVQIKDKRSGNIKSVDKRSADILVKLKKAEYYIEPRNAYQTKVMVPATPDNSEPDTSSANATPPSDASVSDEPLETRQEIVNNDHKDEQKRRGRRPKNTYKTKVMTAKD